MNINIKNSNLIHGPKPELDFFQNIVKSYLRTGPKLIQKFNT